MDGKFIQFGDIFKHSEHEYIFLAQSEVIYAALILDETMTRKVKEVSDSLEKRNMRQKDNPAYAIVILDTAEFKGRGAHFARTDNTEHQTTSFDIVGKINKKDSLQIKDEIIAEKSVVPIKLIEIVKGLNIN